ncbi:adenylosuccinate lyase [Lacticaseibacillus saniviri JCM 17471 = DSM 24301]|uniref:Adenylosuccinate lyase n=1 Tax=Lacticaseibacillus saniviri JCM 17471 = DSM 24301 TaxID=1293598 RepID=A0A0R2MQY6_9LACO|nr:adenylosuccinate lyase [Lacticaseibacillus saniviri JCM 17471 = DSM 24301]
MGEKNLIPRYSREEMAHVWSEENRYAAWLEVEILAAEAWASLGEIPVADAQALRKNATFNVDRIHEIEEITRHDVVAFTRNVSESLGDEKKWVHFGLTSTDVVDTAQGYVFKQADAILRQDIDGLLAALAKLAVANKDVVMMGRTHGVHAEPTTFGLVVASWYSEMKRNRERFDQAADEVEAGKISGAVGTFANTPPEVEAYVTEHLGIRAQEISTQVLPRDLHARYIQTLGLIATSIERFATQIRHMQRTEVHEVEEHFNKGQKGSSAMPHKRNPISSENVSGLARVIRSYQVAALEDVALWHERDISHSSAERMMLPDATGLLDYILVRFTKIIDNLDVFPDTMLANMQKTHGLIYSQRVMLKLIESGLSREAAYDLVQPKTAVAWDEHRDFRELLEADPEVTDRLSTADLDDAFDYHYHLKRVDTIFKRVGLI